MFGKATLLVRSFCSLDPDFLFIGSRQLSRVCWVRSIQLDTMLSPIVSPNVFYSGFSQCFLLKVFPLKILSISNVSLPCFMVWLFVNWIQTFCSFNPDNFVKSWLSSLNSIGHWDGENLQHDLSERKHNISDLSIFIRSNKSLIKLIFAGTQWDMLLTIFYVHISPFQMCWIAYVVVFNGRWGYG